MKLTPQDKQIQRRVFTRLVTSQHVVANSASLAFLVRRAIARDSIAHWKDSDAMGAVQRSGL